MPKVGQYAYDSKILARGFTSIVYQGVDQITKEKVAIKAIDQSILDQPQKKKMLTNELNIQWQLRQQPYTVEIKAQFYQKDSIYIVTEFCEYGDLKSKIKQKGKFVQPKAVSYILDIIKGFQTLVKHNIVHRDLKPANILISKKGVKVGDFGFAYKISKVNSKDPTNIPNAGSPLYMAPQVLEDGRNSSHASDVWSIGVIFYEMITGRLPFPAKNKESLVKLIQRTGIRTLIPQKLSPKSKQFLLRTLKKDPQKRITPEQLDNFRFDDEILFKLKDHRHKKQQERKRRKQMGIKSPSSQQHFESEQKEKTLNKKQSTLIGENKHHFHNNPQTEKAHNSHHKNSKQHQPQKPTSGHHSNVHPQNLHIKITVKQPPTLLKNNGHFDDDQQLNYKHIVDKKQLNIPHQERFKRKSHEKKTFIDNLGSDKILQVKNKIQEQHQHIKKQVQKKKQQQKGSSHRSNDENIVTHHKQKHSKEHQTNKDQHHSQSQVLNNGKHHHQSHNYNESITHKESHNHSDHSESHHTNSKVKETKKYPQNNQDRQIHEANKIQSIKRVSSQKQPQSTHQNNNLKRKDSILSVQSESCNSEIKKEQIIEILLNQIDIIRFLSRIVHKLEELHHIHIEDKKSQSHIHNSNGQSRKSSTSKQSHQGLESKINQQFLEPPLIYTLLKQLIYKTILQIEKLQFLSDQQAYKFFRSQEFDQIKVILDTYKTKLQLTELKSFKWKGMKPLEHELQKQILIVYNTIKDRISRYQSKNLSSDSKEIKKLNHKIQALHYLLVLRFDYLIVQREQMFIQDNSSKKDKHSQGLSQIKAIIQNKHSSQSNSNIKKSVQDCKKQVQEIEKKMKKIKLIL